MSAAGLLKFENPLQINDYYSVSIYQQEEFVDSEEDIDIIKAILNQPLELYHDDENVPTATTTETFDSEEDLDDFSDMPTVDRILDILIPPIEWNDENGVKCVQRVSRDPPSRNDVIQLWEHLDMKLKERQARLTGICPVRRELYSEAFDELIRQVTLDCTERGLLLARVRDEADMTIAAFQSLLQSASDFGSTKAIQAESGKSELEEEVETLEVKVSELKAENRRLKALGDQVTRRAKERKEVQMTLFNEELECLQRSEQQYQTLIETLLAGKSSGEK